MQALAVTLCLVMIVNILQPHLSLYKPAAAVAIPKHKISNKPCNERKLEDQLSVQRIEVLRGEILSKLSYEQVPDNLASTELSEEDFATFSAAVALDDILTEQREQQKVSGCHGEEKETFYAKEVKLHFPSHFEGDLPSVNIFNWESILSAKRFRRDKGDKGVDDKDDIAIKIDPDVKPETMIASTDPPNYTTPPPTLDTKRLTSLLTPVHYTLNFTDLHLPATAPIWSASLQLFKQKIVSNDNSLKRTSNPTENIEIYWKSIYIANNDKHIPYPVLIQSQDVRTEKDQYVSFDVTEAVEGWRREGVSTQQLQFEVVIRCPESAETGLLFLPSIQFDVPNSSNKGNKGYNNANLIITVVAEAENNSTRKKRQTFATKKEYCLANPAEETCCIKQSIVNFHDDLGFYWIRAPTTFQLTYCKGVCPRILSSGTSNLEFRSQLRTTNPTSSPEPCCVPHETRSLTLLTVHEGKPVLLKLPGMIVDSCQCR